MYVYIRVYIENDQTNKNACQIAIKYWVIYSANANFPISTNFISACDINYCQFLCLCEKSVVLDYFQYIFRCFQISKKWIENWVCCEMIVFCLLKCCLKHGTNNIYIHNRFLMCDLFDLFEYYQYYLLCTSSLSIPLPLLFCIFQWYFNVSTNLSTITW